MEVLLPKEDHQAGEDLRLYQAFLKLIKAEVIILESEINYVETALQIALQ